MERLTDRNDVGNYFYPKCFEKCDGLGASRKCDNCDITTSICEKLGKYEDLEEQGRLIKLPCKVGDTVWKVEERLEHTYIERLVIDRIEVNDNYIYYFANEKITGESVILDNCDFSKTVFLTKSEAEAKLKEMEGADGN